MKENKLTEYGRYLTSLSASVINGTAPQKPFEGLDWERLYKLALFHNIAVLIYPALKKLSVPDDVMHKFTQNYQMMVAREARQEIEARRVFSVLEADGISYIKLKGIALKNLYPAPFMRTHADVDICMSKDNRIKARKIMQSLGYSFMGGIDYHDEYEMGNFYIYELHSSVMSSRSEFYELFDRPFEKSKLDGSSKYSYVFRDEYMYLHLLIHLYKHFVSEGCGIRLFCDLYVFEKVRPKLDFGFIENCIAKYGLDEFYQNVRHLLNCFFGGCELTGKHVLIADFILRSGEAGSPELKRLSWISSTKTADLSFSDKVKYLFSNWFPGVSSMKKKYPVLDRVPLLLPVCWLRRGIYTLFYKRASLKIQGEEIKRLNSDKLKEAKKIHSLAGIR